MMVHVAQYQVSENLFNQPYLRTAYLVPKIDNDESHPRIKKNVVDNVTNCNNCQQSFNCDCETHLRTPVLDNSGVL